MIITKKALARRTFLRGMGATVALPLLDAMIPSLTAQSLTAASPVRRLGFVYVPMGSHITNWTPPGEAGALTALSTTLSPLAPVMKNVTVNQQHGAEERVPGTHANVERGVLELQRRSGRKARLLPRHDRRSDPRADGAGTQLPPSSGNGSDGKWWGSATTDTPAFTRNNLSWVVADDTAAVEPIRGSCRASVRRRRQLGGAPRRARKRASLLDWVREDIARLQVSRRRGSPPRSAAISRRFAKSSGHSEGRSSDTRQPAFPISRSRRRSVEYAEHAKLMFDLQVLALQGDITALTFQLASRRATADTTRWRGRPASSPDAHGGDPEKLAKVAKINQFTCRCSATTSSGSRRSPTATARCSTLADLTAAEWATRTFTTT